MTEQAEALEGELIPFDANNLKIFDPFESQLKQLAEENKKAIFNYEDPEGNKEARSHIYKIRQTKSALEKKRKQAKQVALDYGRAIDSRAKEINGQLEDMILVHQKPLDEIDQREKDRIAAHQEKLNWLKESARAFIEFPGTAEQIKSKIDDVSAFSVDESLEEFFEEAKMLKAYALSELQERHDAAAKAEAEAAEQERIRKEEEDRQRQEREEKIRADAEAKAKLDAEEAAQKQAAESKQREEKLAKEKADAEARAENAAKEAREQAEREQAEKEAKEKAEREARERDQAHRGECNRAARDAFMNNGFSQEAAEAAVKLIASGAVPRVTINY